MISFERKSIQGFIEHKRGVEKERPFLTSEPKLITVDGVDGSGKSTITKKLFEKLKQKYGEDGVVLVDITNLKGSLRQERLKDIVNSKQLKEDQVDKIYMAGVNRAYEELIIPALEKGKIVVVDRSEVDLLRFALESNDQELIKRRRDHIQRGTPTHRLWAGNRIFIEANPDDIWKNLSERHELSRYDPQNLEEVQRRIGFHEQATKEIEAMRHIGEINIIKENNIKIENTSDRDQFFKKLIEEIIEKLNLPQEKSAKG